MKADNTVDMVQAEKSGPPQLPKKSRKDFVESITAGCIIAFNTDDGMLSGRVIQIANEHVTVRTKNGSVFYPKKSQIVWVKTGNRWPLGIHNALALGKRSSQAAQNSPDV